jgi:AcrR family transcriptional regulator
VSTGAEGRERAPRRAPSARAAILRAARRLYLAHGPDGVSARKIAREVGCSPTAIYLYYRSVPDLLEHLRMEGHAILSARLREVPTTLPAAERIRAMGRAYFRFGKEHAAFYALMFGVRPSEQPRREAVQREMQTLLVLRDVVQAGMHAGALRDGDPTIVANALWAQVHGVTALAVSGLLLTTAGGQDEAVLDAVLDGALAPLLGEYARRP